MDAHMKVRRARYSCCGLRVFRLLELRQHHAVAAYGAHVAQPLQKLDQHVYGLHQSAQ